MRNPAIDVARGIGICLVVLGHNWLVLRDHDSALFRVIFSFHMPLFFFLSGLFLADGQLSAHYVWRRADALLKPYFSILVLWGLLRWKHIQLIPYLNGLLYATGFTIDWTPLWFLPHLFLSILAAALCLRWTRQWPHRRLCLSGLSCLLLLLGYCLIQVLPAIAVPWQLNANLNLPGSAIPFPGLPWSLDLLPVSCAYLLAGYLCREASSDLRFSWAKLILAAMLFGALHTIFRVSMDLHLREFGNPWVVIPASLLGIYLVLMSSSRIVQTDYMARVFGYLGKASLCILLFHSWVEWTVFHWLQQRHLSDELSALLALFAGLLVPVLIAELAQRFAMFGKLILPIHSFPAAHKG